jgi:hypothetical protein
VQSSILPRDTDTLQVDFVWPRQEVRGAYAGSAGRDGTVRRRSRRNAAEIGLSLPRSAGSDARCRAAWPTELSAPRPPTSARARCRPVMSPGSTSKASRSCSARCGQVPGSPAHYRQTGCHGLAVDGSIWLFMVHPPHNTRHDHSESGTGRSRSDRLIANVPRTVNSVSLSSAPNVEV